MRFWHKDTTSILAYLEATNDHILALEWDREPVTGGLFFVPQTIKRRGAKDAREASVKDVLRIAHWTEVMENAGTVYREYFHVNSSAVGRPLSLEEAVDFVEEEGTTSEFLLAGYHDGGLISVSRDRLPFQQNLDPITWWGP